MHDLGHGPPIPSTQFLQRHQILTAKIQTEFQPDLESVCPATLRVPNGAGYLSIAIGGVVGGFGGGVQGEALDILAFESTSFEWIGHGREGDVGRENENEG